MEYIYEMYESTIIYHSKVMFNVKVFVYKQTDRLRDGQNLMDQPKTICPGSIDAGA